MAKKEQKPEPKKGAPAYMVSFGDMMTLILCFFILLVSMSTERSYGLLAKGVGSFIVAVESHGLDGVMSDREKREIFDSVRRRFNLPPEEDPERRDAHIAASSFEILKAKALESLVPHRELQRPAVATFDPDSARLDSELRAELDRLADSLRPGRGQVLWLEGHSADAGPNFRGDNPRLAYARADAVRRYLVDEFGFKDTRVLARAWLEEVLPPGPATRSVDARLITPGERPKN